MSRVLFRFPAWHQAGARARRCSLLMIAAAVLSCHPFKSEPERAAEEILETIRAGYSITDQFNQAASPPHNYLTDALWRKNVRAGGDPFEQFKQTLRHRRNHFRIPVSLNGYRKLSEVMHRDTVRFLSQNALARCATLTYELDVKGQVKPYTIILVADSSVRRGFKWKCGLLLPTNAGNKSVSTPLSRNH
ncbi:MAG: hypothetical protein H7Y12_16060 [Sphingobacteriaceae bacterium]|nr:hypothetical protein [Cytophagaceae bacterium]